MRAIKPGLTLAVAGIAALLLAACGGGGGGGNSSGGTTPNVSPVANAGAAQTVTSGTTVTLNGSGTDSDGSIATYAWTQTVGGAVTLSSAATAAPTFAAPAVTAATTLTFSLVVTDNRGASSAASTVNVTVNPPVTTNIPPTANAGAAQSVPAGQLVTLSGVASVDPDGTIASYAWTQTAGTAVTLTGSATIAPSFTAPAVSTSTVFTFSLVVTDNLGASSAASTVNVTVNPTGQANVTITGKIRHARPPFNTTTPFGLNYANAAFEPSRGILVRAVNAGTDTVISAVSTNASGDYSLQVPGNTSIQIRPVAWLIRDSGQPLPRYDMRVQDGVAGQPYTYTDAAFNSASGTTRNVDIPLNVNASGVATGTRASAPFAALDTVYQGMQLILGVAPSTNFPALVLDWGSQSAGTFFSGTNPQRIALLSDLSDDTDEFDAHVVAHEFGHYIEHNFSRSDSIGGPHTIGQRLDIRVAFGEGFGYAFAAMVLNNPNARDSFNNNGTPSSAGFNIESNTTPGGATGCWCSESSVWSILYDIYDSGVESNDFVALGFGPIWNELTGAQRTTPAFTSIFSFATALKAANPAETGINSLLLAQNINATQIDEFGSNENNSVSQVPTEATFPLYSVATIGGPPLVLRTVNDAGIQNKLGNHRYVRFNVGSTRSVTISLATSNASTDADPDFTLWRGATFIYAGTNAPPGPEVMSARTLTPGNYVLDVYDCANGCSDEQGTSGDYDLTVTIN